MREKLNELLARRKSLRLRLERIWQDGGHDVDTDDGYHYHVWDNKDLEEKYESLSQEFQYVLRASTMLENAINFEAKSKNLYAEAILLSNKALLMRDKDAIARLKAITEL